MGKSRWLVSSAAAVCCVVLAVGPAAARGRHASHLPPLPKSGEWKIETNQGGGAGAIDLPVSGSFKLSGKSVSGLRADVQGSDETCRGSLQMSGSVPLTYATNTSNLGVVAGHDEWAVATSGGAVGGAGFVQPTPVVFNGSDQGSLSIVFASGKTTGVGAITWHEGECGLTIAVKRS